MKIQSLHKITLLAFLFAASSCTKVIDLTLGNNTGQLDIEGNLTNVNGTQSIVLRKNVDFSNPNTYPAVTGATVTVTDRNGLKQTLTESQPGTYTINPFVAVAGSIYTLSVITGGQTYTAQSTMPGTVKLDSLSDKNRPLNRNKGGADQKVVTVYYKDPAGIANQYRFIEWVNGVQVKAVFSYDDQLTDGKYVTLDLLEQDIDIYAGDVVKVEMQCIDKPIYTYWFDLQSQQSNNFAGAVAPANPPTNISPSTLGYFSAHTTQTITYTVK